MWKSTKYLKVVSDYLSIPIPEIPNTLEEWIRLYELAISDPVPDRCERFF